MLFFSMLALIVLQVLVFVLIPPPNSAEGFFELFVRSKFQGLLSLDFLYLINNALFNHGLFLINTLFNQT